MTIKKGEAWGEPATPPADAVFAESDRAISLALERCRRDAAPFPSFVVTRGDLGRTLAATGDPRTAFSIDVGEVLVDGAHYYFVAHVAAHDRSWRRFAVAMNAQWVGEWNLGPKAHPNDGIVDGYEARLAAFEWRKVRRRLPTGSHLPHPQIRQTRARAVAFDLPRGLRVWVDGEPLGPATHVAARLLPDALTVYA